MEDQLNTGRGQLPCGACHFNWYIDLVSCAHVGICTPIHVDWPGQGTHGSQWMAGESCKTRLDGSAAAWLMEDTSTSMMLTLCFLNPRSRPQARAYSFYFILFLFYLRWKRAWQPERSPLLWDVGEAQAPA